MAADVTEIRNVIPSLEFKTCSLKFLKFRKNVPKRKKVKIDTFKYSSWKF